MTLPDPTVTIFFGGSVEGGAFFTLNDPVKGALNNTTYLLGGDTGTVVSAEGFDIQISRGRSRVFDDFGAGTATVMLRNHTGNFSMLNPDGPYFGSLVPGKQVTIKTGQQIFTGVADSWEAESDPYGEHTARLTVQDDFTQLARREFTAWTATAGDHVSDRLTAALNRGEVNFGENRDFDTGVAVLQADVVDAGTNVLNYCQLVSQSDFGRFFVSRLGVLTFRDRHTIGETVVIAGETIRLAPVGFSDLPADWTYAPTADLKAVLPFQGITTASGSDLLYNRVTVQRVGGTVQTSNDVTSQNAYGIRELSLSGLLMSTDLEAHNLADFILSAYKDPRERVSSITVNASALENFGPVTSREIGWFLLVMWTPVGASAQRQDLLVIDGIEHSIDVSEHLVTFRTSQANEAASFILNDATFGVLDDDRLGF